MQTKLLTFHRRNKSPRASAARSDEHAISAAMRAYTRAKFRSAVIDLADRLRRADRQSAAELLDELGGL